MRVFVTEGERRGETEGFITVGYCRTHGRGRGGRNWTVCRASAELKTGDQRGIYGNYPPAV